MVEKNVAIRLAAVGGKQVEEQFVDIGREGKRALNDIAGASGNSRIALQNVGFQVQDFAVQVAGGTSASRALAQQLPQLLSGFGLTGVALGTLVALLGPFVFGMFDSSDAVKALDESISDLEKSTTAYQATARNAAIPIETLTLRFGGQADAVRDLYQAQLALAQLDLASKQRAMAAAIGESFAGLTDNLATIDRIRKAMENPIASTEQLANFRDALDVVLSEMGMTEEQARRTQAAINSINQATGPVEAAAGMAELRNSVLDVAGGYSNLNDAQAQLIRLISEAQAAEVSFGSTDMSASLRAANAEALTLIERVNLAINRGEAAQAALANFKVAGIYQQYADSRTAAPKDPVVPKVKSGGGGGGISDAQRVQNQLMEEAKRVFESTRTSAEKYKIELKKLDDLLGKGLITQDTYNRAVDDLKDKFGSVGDAAKEMGNQVGQALQDIIIGGENANEVLSKLLSSFASSLFQSGWDNLMSAFSGGDLFSGLFSAKGNVFEGGDVTAFAKGGIVGSPTFFGMKSGLGLMGEAGPEAIMPLRRGADGKLGVAAGRDGGGAAVTVQVTVDARGAVDGVAQQVSDAVQKHIPSIVKQAVAGVSSAKRRGYPV